MARRKEYRDDARFYEIGGERYPSVTTILNIIAKPGLQYWYGKHGNTKAGEITKASADLGSEIHAAIEAFIRAKLKKKYTVPKLSPAGRKAFEQFKKWYAEAGIKPLGAEQRIYSKEYGYAGTLDIYFEKNGKRYVGDWKTGTRVYPEAYLQNVAYRQACHELRMPSAGGVIIHVPRDGSRVVPHMVPRTTKLDAFLAALELWKWHRLANGKDIA